MSNTYNTKHKTVYGCPKSGAHRKKRNLKIFPIRDTYLETSVQTRDEDR